MLLAMLSVTGFSQVRISALPTLPGNNVDSAWVPLTIDGSTKKARGYQFGSTQDIDSLTRSVSGCRVIYTTWKNGTGTNIDTAYRRDGIVTGGLILNRLNDSTFRISAAQYLIGCSNYNSPLDTITLAGSTGSALSRFYTIGFDNTNNVFFSAGTPSASPQIPQVDEATQIGKYTVFFPAGSDSGITNIYNTVTYSGVDSGAIYSFTQLDSFNILACRRNGICDTLRSIYTAGGGTGGDSIRISSQGKTDSFFLRKNGVFVFQGTINHEVGARANNKFQRVYSGVIRATTTGANQPITWAFLDSSSLHQAFGFDSVKGNSNAIQIYYPKVKNVSSFLIGPDETLANAGVIVGSSVGDSVANCFAYITTQSTGVLTGNGSTWSNSGIGLSGLTYSSSTGLTTFTPTTSFGTIYSGSPELEGTVIQSVGDTMRYIRRVYSSLGGQTLGFRMLDSIGRTDTGQLSAQHKLVVIIPRTKTVGIPAQTSSSNGFPNDLYTASANYWIIASMDVYLIASATSSTTASIEWQTADIPTNQYATSYRITRATAANPLTETTIFNGFGFIYNDTGLTANTRYIYRMYATLPTVGERLITNEKIKTD